MPDEPPITPVTEDAPALPEWRDRWHQTLGWQPSDTQQAQFQQFYAAVVAANAHLNLTRIVTPADFWEKHLWDSLRGLRADLIAPEQVPLQVIDIGTGAGFPGVPCAIAGPHWHVALMDATRKKMHFLREAIAQLGLTNTTVITARAEALGQQPRHRAQYDRVLVRAVAGVAACAEYALPLLKVGGEAVLYRGHWTEAEASTLTQVLPLLGGELVTVDAFQTPITGGDRHCLYLRKVAPTPAEFPRAIGVPQHHPLGAPVSQS